jgi:hypothetical protein
MYLCSNKRRRKEFLLHCDPTFGLAGGLIGGGILSGGAIPIIVGGGLAVGWIFKEGVPLFKGIKDKIKKAQEEKEKSGGGGGNNNNNNNNDKDKNKNKRFINKNDKSKNQPSNGIYEENPKHNPNSRDGVGKPPPNGSKALQESIKFKDGQRVAIQDKKIIVLKEHEPGKWHGYIEKDFHNLDPDAQKALVKEGWVRSIKSGKIIKK